MENSNYPIQINNLFVLTFILIGAIFFMLSLCYVVISKNRKMLISEIKNLLFYLKNDNNLLLFIHRYDIIVKKIKDSKYFLPFGKDKYSLLSFKKDIIQNRDKYIKNVLLNNYKLIVDDIRTKQINFALKIYKNSQELKSTIITYNNKFDEGNKKLSEIIVKKLEAIINFTEKYRDIYDVNIRYNLDEMSGQDFERYCANLLIGFGFTNVGITKGSGDQGVDIIGWYGGHKYAIQCKRYSHKLGNGPVQEVVAGKNYYGCQIGIVMTNNYFTDSAIALAEANNIELWNRNHLMALIYFTDKQWDELLEKIKLEITDDKSSDEITKEDNNITENKGR